MKKERSGRLAAINKILSECLPNKSPKTGIQSREGSRSSLSTRIQWQNAFYNF